LLVVEAFKTQKGQPNRKMVAPFNDYVSLFIKPFYGLHDIDYFFLNGFIASFELLFNLDTSIVLRE
tara:strand:+ start:298 stop:495 length:198 start_codon:yes stop_codon:yes gene_type:complete